MTAFELTTGSPQTHCGSILIGTGELHVWRVRLTSDACGPESILAVDERRRADRFRYQIDRGRFVAARAALRTILARYVGLAPERLRFCYPCRCGNWRCSPAHRKPALVTESGGEFIRFNLSHSDGLAAIVVCGGCEVGIDVERMDGAMAAQLCANDFPSTEQVGQTGPIPADLKSAEFYRYWTRREAMTKALGLGLAMERALPPALDGESGPALGEWWVRDFEPAPGYVGALAVQDPLQKTQVRFIEFSRNGRS